MNIIVNVTPARYANTVVESLPPTEFKIRFREGGLLLANTTRKGLEILKKNPYVLSIEFDRPLEWF